MQNELSVILKKRNKRGEEDCGYAYDKICGMKLKIKTNVSDDELKKIDYFLSPVNNTTPA